MIGCAQLIVSYGETKLRVFELKKRITDSRTTDSTQRQMTVSLNRTSQKLNSESAVKMWSIARASIKYIAFLVTGVKHFLGFHGIIVNKHLLTLVIFSEIRTLDLSIYIMQRKTWNKG